MKGVPDLNAKMAFRANAGGNLPGVAYERRQDAVRATDGLPAMEEFPSHCRSKRRRPLCEVDDVRRTIPCHGLRPADLSGESARHRNWSLGTVGQALPHGVPAGDQALHAGRYQRDPGLAHPCRVRAAIDRASQEALCRRQPERGVGEHGLCLGLHHHRFMLSVFPWAPFRTT